MSDFKEFLLTSVIIIIFITGLIHVVFGFLLNNYEFSTYQLFDSSPLFDFSISDNCGSNSSIIFHTWKGRFEKYRCYDEEEHSYDTCYKIVDETDIKKINGKYFCYNYKSYRDLLNSGQIIKKGEECPVEFQKNCGKLDTLEQELCIKYNEKCPLYDLGIGYNNDTDNYINEGKSIYYNNDNYNKTNKTIIGSLFLNDGQPCYDSNEKLWRSFYKEETFKTHLKCDKLNFNKERDERDERYVNKGSISYKALYEENLNANSKALVLNYINGEAVSLYTRELLGINKECDEKFSFSKDSFDTYNTNIDMLSLLLKIEGVLFMMLMFITFLIERLPSCGSKEEFEKKHSIFALILFHFFYSIILFPCFISHLVFFLRINKYNLVGYNCSDPITNEFIKKSSGVSDAQIIFVAINFYLDASQFGINFLSNIVLVIILFCCNKKKEEVEPKNEEKNEDKYYESKDFKLYNEPNNSKTPLNTGYSEPN